MHCDRCLSGVEYLTAPPPPFKSQVGIWETVAGRGRKWDAASYEDVAIVQSQWGRALLDSHPWRGDEKVVDAGCGPGTLAEEILRRAPRGSVVAIDSDASMAQAARARLAGHPGRARVVHADLLDGPAVTDADVVFSNAVIHWIPDHARLLRVLHAMLRPGGRLLAQGGGRGNLARVRGVADTLVRSRHFARAFSDWKPPWHYAGVHATVRNLAEAGFSQPDVTLHPAPVTFRDDAAFRRFLDAVILRPYHARLSGQEREAFTDAFIGAKPDRTLDYVRLTIRAVA